MQSKKKKNIVFLEQLIEQIVAFLRKGNIFIEINKHVALSD